MGVNESGYGVWYGIYVLCSDVPSTHLCLHLCLASVRVTYFDPVIGYLLSHGHPCAHPMDQLLSQPTATSDSRIITMSTEASTPQPIQPAQQQQAQAQQASTSATTAPQPQAQPPPNGSATTSTNGNNATGDDSKDAPDQSDVELTKLFTARREEDMARRDRTLAEFLVMLDGYKPLVIHCL
jgi:hypothetical protein